MNCIVCGEGLTGRQKKYCSNKCKFKAFNAKTKRKEYEKQRQYRRNKYIKKPSDTWDRTGERNPNWKGGISKNHMRYKRRFVEKNPMKHIVQNISYNILRKVLREGKVERGSCIICGKSNADMHHPDYSKPLEIVWLCRKHHIQADRNKISIPPDKIIRLDSMSPRPAINIKPNDLKATYTTLHPSQYQI